MTTLATTTVITGAAGGLGQAMARDLGMRGHRLVLTDRTAEGLSALAGKLPGIQSA